MVSLTALWLPIALSAVAVFVASSIIHMVFRYHNSEYRQLPDEGAVLAAMRSAGISPGFYSFPYAASLKEMGSPEMMEKYKQGPMGTANINPNGPPAMGKHLAQWFAYTLLVGAVSAYLAGRMLAPGAEYLEVFRVTGTVAFASYAMALMQRSIWFGQRWSTTLKSMFDGMIYAALTGGAFGWLWPV